MDPASDRQSQLEYLSQTLQTFSVEPLESFEDHQQVLKVIEELVSKLQKEILNKQNITEALYSAQSQIRELETKAERLEDSKHKAEYEAGRFQDKLYEERNKAAYEYKQLKREKEELSKEISKLVSKDQQHITNYKRLETQYNKLRDQMSKTLLDKENTQNHIEVTSVLNKSGVSTESIREDQEFLYYIREGYSKFEKLASEKIQTLSECLNNCLETISEFLKTKDQKVSVAVNLKEDMKDRVNSMLQVFKKEIQKDQPQEDPEFPNHTVPQLKDLLKAYKEQLQQADKIVQQANLIISSN